MEKQERPLVFVVVSVANLLSLLCFALFVFIVCFVYPMLQAGLSILDCNFGFSILFLYSLVWHDRSSNLQSIPLLFISENQMTLWLYLINYDSLIVKWHYSKYLYKKMNGIGKTVTLWLVGTTGHVWPLPNNDIPNVVGHTCGYVLRLINVVW